MNAGTNFQTNVHTNVTFIPVIPFLTAFFLVTKGITGMNVFVWLGII